MARYGESAAYGEDDYYVRLRSGRVDAYGKVGDFDSTHPQKYDVDINVNGSTAQSTPPQPSAFDQAYQEGITAMANKDFGAAALSFQKATFLDRSSLDAWTALGVAQGYSHDFPDALYSLQRALQLDPSRLPALAALAGVYGQIGETNKYVETLEKVRRVDPALADTVAEFVREENAKR